mgnify:FL=1
MMFHVKIEVVLVFFVVFPGYQWSVHQANTVVEGVTHKIWRQVEELERISGSDSGTLSVDGVPVDSYITRWMVISLTKVFNRIYRILH